jgi:hypothetical protein
MNDIRSVPTVSDAKLSVTSHGTLVSGVAHQPRRMDMVTDKQSNSVPLPKPWTRFCCQTS